MSKTTLKTPKPEQNMKSLEVSSSKNNSLLIFFYIFTMYIFISVLNTTDLMLLLPTHTFKMPFIGFDLNLIFFYVLAPLLLILLHFNILFNYYVHLKKLHTYKDQVILETIDPSIYSYAYVLTNDGFIKGILINLFLWLLIYLFPLYVLISTYLRFADYHHHFITILHLSFILIDIALIYFSILYNKKYLNHAHAVTKIFSYVFLGFIFFAGLIQVLYFKYYFYPLIYSDYDAKLIELYTPSKYTQLKVNPIADFVCRIENPVITYDKNISLDCFPRIVVTDEEMAKISPSALYIPRYLAVDALTKDIDKEKKLILNYGTRVNLANRNLRYADLQNCILTRADLSNTQLQAANLQGSHLQAADLTDAKLQDAILIDAKLQAVYIVGAQLQGTSFARADMPNLYYQDNNMSGTSMQGANLESAVFQGIILNNVDFRNAKLNMANFMDANISNSSFQKAHIKGAVFDNAMLIADDFSDIRFNDNTSFKDTSICCLSMSNSIKKDLNLTQSQKRLIYDNNISKEDSIKTFNERKIVYIQTAITKLKSKIDKKQLVQLKSSLVRSCQQLKPKIHYEVEKREFVYDKLDKICSKGTL